MKSPSGHDQDAGSSAWKEKHYPTAEADTGSGGALSSRLTWTGVPGLPGREYTQQVTRPGGVLALTREGVLWEEREMHWGLATPALSWKRLVWVLVRGTWRTQGGSGMYVLSPTLLPHAWNDITACTSRSGDISVLSKSLMRQQHALLYVPFVPLWLATDPMVGYALSRINLASSCGYLQVLLRCLCSHRVSLGDDLPVRSAHHLGYPALLLISFPVQ